MAKSKYRAKKTEINGLIFDSKAESTRYLELKAMQEAGEISELELQPVIELFEAFTFKGKRYRKTTYVADFSYIQDGERIWEDVKSPATRTQLYMLKKKLAAMQGYDVREIMPKKV